MNKKAMKSLFFNRLMNYVLKNKLFFITLIFVTIIEFILLSTLFIWLSMSYYIEKEYFVYFVFVLISIFNLYVIRKIVVNKYLKNTIIITTVLLLLCPFYSFCVKKYFFNISSTNARELIFSIEKYKIKYNFYPNCLNDLTPEFIEKRPKYYIAYFPNNFKYNKDKNGFYLSYIKYNGCFQIYSSSTKKWINRD